MEIKTKLNEIEYTIKPAPFEKILGLINFIEKIPSEFADIDTEDKSNNMAIFIKLIKTHTEDIFNLLSDFAGVEVDVIRNLDLKSVIRLFRVLLEVNEVEEIKKEIGEVTQMFKKETKTGSGK